MIGKLRGIVDSVEAAHVILDVNGVGYLVFASGRTLGKCVVGEAASLVIETHVREDHIHLYGFGDVSEKDWFNILMTVQGVGAKVALAILTALTTDNIMLSIAAQDKAAFKAVSGIGPKLAERIVIELKNKVGELPAAKPITSQSRRHAATPDVLADVVSALTHLGYNRTTAFEVAARHAKSAATVESVLKECLKDLA